MYLVDLEGKPHSCPLPRTRGIQMITQTLQWSQSKHLDSLATWKHQFLLNRKVHGRALAAWISERLKQLLWYQLTGWKYCPKAVSEFSIAFLFNFNYTFFFFEERVINLSDKPGANVEWSFSPYHSTFPKQNSVYDLQLLTDFIHIFQKSLQVSLLIISHCRHKSLRKAV